ncbi:prolyl endopeptidase FAP-like [Brevipalpus obovatus]|uniref:prolyl endopeptidase FAP-like n=1 Tax=Brevipalpus obovatus TaxID=246614 RepID=UPI003D9DE3DF
MAENEIEFVQPTPQTEMDALLLGRTKELAAVVEGSGRNWRGIGIAALVIFVICGLIGATVFSLSPELRNFHKRSRKNEIEMNDFLSGEFYPRQFNGTWLSGKELMYRDEINNLLIWNVDQNISSSQQLVSNTVFTINNAQDFSLSADRTHLLLLHGMEKIFRHTFTAHLSLYRIKDEELIHIPPKKKNIDKPVQYAAWGPNGTQLIYVLNNNIYYQPSVDSSPIQLTTDGNISQVYNGVPDWLYEEEILASSNAIWWSPLGARICYGRFDDSLVDTIDYQYYDVLFGPKTIGLRYPRPGTKNPLVSLNIVDLESFPPKSATLRPPRDITKGEYYFTSIKWLNDKEISVIWTTRVQNSSVVSICSEKDDWTCRTILPIRGNGRGWVETRSSMLLDSSKNNYFFILPSFQSQEDGYFQHIIRLSLSSPKIEQDKFLTSGLYEVTELLGYDEIKDLLFYQATMPNEPGERHIFMVKVKTKSISCLSCDLGSECLYNSATFSPSSDYYALDCLGPGVPFTQIRQTASNKIVTTIQNNGALRDKLANMLLPSIKELKVPIEGGYRAQVQLLLPPSLRENEIAKYPMLINVYAGPGSQVVKKKFQMNWGTYLAARRGMIYGLIDARGSGFSGDKIMHELYRKLGTVEVDDQISVTRYLKDKFPFIDPKRIGIWGWSYGGYVTSMIMASEKSGPQEPEPVFSCGIAVAPVSSWFLYDSAYTERYMGFPINDNHEHYEKSQIFNIASNIKGKNFLLIHGTADDNVHVQQSMLLMKLLQKQNILFRSQIYPDQNHALPTVTRHLYRTMEAFLKECFNLETVYEEVGLQRRRIVRSIG